MTSTVVLTRTSLEHGNVSRRNEGVDGATAATPDGCRRVPFDGDNGDNGGATSTVAMCKIS